MTARLACAVKYAPSTSLLRVKTNIPILSTTSVLMWLQIASNGDTPKTFGNVNYSFIAITPRSTLTLSRGTC